MENRSGLLPGALKMGFAKALAVLLKALAVLASWLIAAVVSCTHSTLCCKMGGERIHGVIMSSAPHKVAS